MEIVELLEKYKIPFRREGHEHCRPGWIQLDCPRCHRIGHFRLGYSLAGRYLNCWSCGSMPLAFTLHELSGAPFRDIKADVRDVDRDRSKEPEKDRGEYKPPDGVGPLLVSHANYLRERGFDPATVRKIWGVRGLGATGRLSWRLFLPVAFEGRPVSWTTRSIIPGDTGRYRSASPAEEEIDHKKLLYGQDYARQAIVVVEGPTDAWAGGPGTVATFGTAYSRAQLLRIAGYPRRTVIFDNEPEAQRRARGLSDDLSVFPGITKNVILDAHDLATAKPRDVALIRKSFIR